MSTLTFAESSRFQLFVAAVCWSTSLWLVLALALGVGGAADLSLFGGFWSVVLSFATALVGVLVLVTAHRTPVSAAGPWRLVQVVAITWGLFRLFGSGVGAFFAVSPVFSVPSAVLWRDVVVLAVLAVSGAGLAVTGIRVRTGGLTPVLVWAGSGLVVAAVAGVSSAGAGSAVVAALLLSSQVRRS